MTIKKLLINWIRDANSLLTGAVSTNAFGNTKAVKAPRRPNIPKTPADYEAMHVAEMKRRRKAALRAQQHTSAA